MKKLKKTLSESEKRLNLPVKTLNQDTKVVFLKSPLGDLGVKIYNI